MTSSAMSRCKAPAHRGKGALSMLLLTSLLGTACGVSAYTGKARELRPEALRSEPGWLAVEEVPFLHQHGEHDCGPTALAMVLAYWHPGEPRSHFMPVPTAERTSAGDLRDHAQALGLAAFVVEGTFEDIEFELERRRPVIVGVAKPGLTGPTAHYEVVVGLHVKSRRIATLDPAAGLRQNSLVDFLYEWIPTGRVLLVMLPRAKARPSN